LWVEESALRSAVAADEAGVEREREELEMKLAVLRPEVLEALRRLNHHILCILLYLHPTTFDTGRHGHADAAFTLAEQYRDFSSLASLCHKESVYPPENNPHTLRIQGYFERFREEFAMELYRWYIQHG
jgi:nuclear pore complex protein Nup133